MFDRVPAEEVMRRPRMTLQEAESIQEAAAKMYHMQDDAAPVLNENEEVTGYVSTDSLMTAMMKGLPPETVVADMMERFPRMLKAEDTPSIYWKWEPPCLPVIDADKKLQGIVYAVDWLEKTEVVVNETEALFKAVSACDSEVMVIADKSGRVKWKTDSRLFPADLSQLEDLSFYNEITELLHDSGNNSRLDVDGRPFRLRVDRLTVKGRAYTAVRLLPAEQTSVPADGEGWKERAEQMEMVIELSHDGIIMVDRGGVITMVNKEYADFIGLSQDELVGKHVTEVIENTRMHIVAETGKPEIADIQKIKGDYMVANRLPIYREGKLEGAVGKVLFKNLGGFKALKHRIENLEKELATYRGEWQETNRAKYQFEQLIGRSRTWEKTKHLARQAAETDSNVLLQGESGTGKELFAHAIHNAGVRSPGPFVKVNCAAIPRDLIESELFGYVEGSFTGAKRGGKKGKFEAAEGGTIFLDEIGELPIHMQVKLLRVLQEREIERIGATGAKPVNIRVIAATNRDLEQMIEDGDFRLDLYYRLNVFTILIPPLHSRKEDIDVLLPYFLRKVAGRLGKPVPSVDPEAMPYFHSYSWPGNTRELENVIERTVNVLKNGRSISSSDLPPKLFRKKNVKEPRVLSETLFEAEQKAVNEALLYTNGNKSKAAKLLGISRTALYEKIAKPH
ncbi:sigma 54-interacting transcriptional regulator [Alkalicoccus halolimnae]|uniref:Sigma 54-interacting transcriptional regulator n=1 Tax=Alkalicoccus halolimnae TaxID=1667239 RepID=A0A5C7FKW5_9BACI|nr:sigma 54-interacting transcriptional regulator [Alkalicoccus halolimnae]TXF86954.1 PAS domain S-box protein [Alkalicoccus halolimnae]